MFQLCPEIGQIRAVQGNDHFVIALHFLTTEIHCRVGREVHVRLESLPLIPLDIDRRAIVTGCRVKRQRNADGGILLVHLKRDDWFVCKITVISARFYRPERNLLRIYGDIFPSQAPVVQLTSDRRLRRNTEREFRRRRKRHGLRSGDRSVLVRSRRYVLVKYSSNTHGVTCASMGTKLTSISPQ